MRGNVPGEDFADQLVAIATNGLPAATDISDLTGSKPGDGVSQIFLLPVMVQSISLTVSLCIRRDT